MSTDTQAGCRQVEILNNVHYVKNMVMKTLRQLDQEKIHTNRCLAIIILNLWDATHLITTATP